MSTDEKLLTKNTTNVAIVGCGNIAGYIDDDPKKRHIYTHAKAIGKIQQLKLIACCDTDENSVKRFSEKWDVPARYSNLDRMLKSEAIDILVIATPTEFHYENVLLALSSEVKVIFCEKPLTFDYKLGFELVEQAKLRNKLLIINHMRRWDKFYAECKSLLESGEIGRVETIVAYVDTALYMNSIHMLDMLVYFAGHVVSGMGFLDKTNDTRIVHEKKDFGGIALFKHKNGIISFLKAVGESRRNHYFELDIQGTKGRLRILDDDTKYELYKFTQSPQHAGLDELALVHTKINDNTSERMVDVYLDILGYLNQEKVPYFLASEALESLKMINLIYKSDSLNNLPVSF